MTDIDQYFKNSKDLSDPELAAAKITAEELMEIYLDYIKSLKELEAEGTYLSNRLQFCPDINSVRWRTKEPIHLLTKIVRKRKEALQEGVTSSPYLSIGVNNYKQVITDLIGLRAIYLFKFQWELVDIYILNNFKLSPDEEIKIYHAPEDDLTFYYENGYETKIGDTSFKYVQSTKKSKYRSTHYIVEANYPHQFKLEIQIRSILDEAWGEIDHHIRYPDHQNDEDLKRKMTILNGAINGCEELATSYIEYFQNKNREVVNNVLLEPVKEGVSTEDSHGDQGPVEEGVSTEDSQELVKDMYIEDDVAVDFKAALNDLALQSDVNRITTLAYPSFSEKLHKQLEEQTRSTLRVNPSFSEKLRKQ
ncbi:hypothetical protein F925_00040, partial [Acinetobacter lwoffii NCTC 5866 = CIP 64.10 = NIPH 512]